MLHLPKESKDLTTGTYKNPKYETTYFNFGGFDWNISVHPFGDERNDGRPLIYLVRQTSFSHFCRIRYRLILGQGERKLDSDIIEQTLNTSGTGSPYDVRYNIYSLTTAKTSRLKLRAELYSVVSISEVQIDPFMKGKNRGTFYDKDKQAWLFEVDTTKEYLHLYLFYKDVFNVPRKYMRCVEFSVSLQPIKKRDHKPAKTIGCPYHCFYAQSDQDEGMDLGTDVRVEEVRFKLN